MRFHINDLTENMEEKLEHEFSDISGDVRSAYSIPKEAFSGYRVKRGLREPDGTGVVAGVTRIGNAHGYIVSEGERIPVEGVLEYRGYDMTELVHHAVDEKRFGFEECAYLLFFGTLPTKDKLEEFTDILAAARHLPNRFTDDIIMRAPSKSIMNKIASSVLALYSYDDDPDDLSVNNLIRQSIELLARIPVIAAQSYAVYKNAFLNKSLNIHNPRDGLSTAENFLRVLRTDKSYTEEEARLLDVALIIHAEHGGGNCSTFSTRVLSSSGTDTYSAVSAGIGALKGPRHGGANIKVQEMFDYIKENISSVNNDGEIKDILYKIIRKEAYDRAGLIYGMGHAVYTLSDPRAVMLKKYAKDLAEEKGFGDDFKLLEKIEKLTPDIFDEYKGAHREMCANVDLYSGLVYRMLDIPTEMYTPLFAIARTAGFCAHRIEESVTAGKIIRPAYKCIAQPIKYVNMSERK